MNSTSVNTAVSVKCEPTPGEPTGHGDFLLNFTQVPVGHNAPDLYIPHLQLPPSAFVNHRSRKRSLFEEREDRSEKRVRFAGGTGEPTIKLEAETSLMERQCNELLSQCQTFSLENCGQINELSSSLFYQPPAAEPDVVAAEPDVAAAEPEFAAANRGVRPKQPAAQRRSNADVLVTSLLQLIDEVQKQQEVQKQVQLVTTQTDNGDVTTESDDNGQVPESVDNGQILLRTTLSVGKRAVEEPKKKKTSERRLQQYRASAEKKRAKNRRDSHIVQKLIELHPAVTAYMASSTSPEARQLATELMALIEMANRAPNSSATSVF